MRSRLLSFSVLSLFILLCFACSKEQTCNDGCQNQGETGVDCGGPCPGCDVNLPSCDDNTQNQGETGVDCGGPCPACDPTIETCTDGIQNQDETGIDCGGVCDPCDTEPTNAVFTANIDGTDWTATDGEVTEISPGSYIISGTTVGEITIGLTFFGATEPGNYSLVVTNTSYVNSMPNINCLLSAGQTGSVDISDFDLTNNLVSGTFAFSCTDISATPPTNSELTGSFENLPYNP